MSYTWKNQHHKYNHLKIKLRRFVVKLNRWWIFFRYSGNPNDDPYMLTSRPKQVPLISLRTEECSIFLINDEFFGEQNNKFRKIPLEYSLDKKNFINKFKRQGFKELIKKDHENNRLKLDSTDEVEFDIFSDFSYETKENNLVQQDGTKLASQMDFECTSKDNDNSEGKELDLDKTYGNTRTQILTIHRDQSKDENKKAEQKLHILQDSIHFFSNLYDDLSDNSQNIINSLSLPNNKFQNDGIRMQRESESL